MAYGDGLSALYASNPEAAAMLRRRRFAETLMQQGSSSEPVQHWTQGLNRMAQALLGGYLGRQADEGMEGLVSRDRQAAETSRADLMRMLGGDTGEMPPMARAVAGETPPLAQRVHMAEAGGSMAHGIYGDGGQAAGPMQVHPAALADYNRANGTNYTHQQLAADPSIGKVVGDWYLAEQVRAFGGDERMGAAAYNAGPGRVAAARAQYGDQWERGLPDSTRETYLPKVFGQQGGAPPPPDRTQAMLAQANQLQMFAAQAAGSPNPAIQQQGKIAAARADMLYRQAEAATKKTELLTPEQEDQKIRIGQATRPTTETRVQVTSGNEAAKKAVENYDQLVQDVGPNQRVLANLQAFRTAMQGFTPGLGAEHRATFEKAKSFLGLPNTADMAAVLSKAQADLKMAAGQAFKGQGQVSNYERELANETVELLGNTPEGALAVMRMIEAGIRRQEEIKGIYERNAADNGGVPSLFQIGAEISKLGPANDPAFLADLQRRVDAVKKTRAPEPEATRTTPEGQIIRTYDPATRTFR